MRLKRSEWFLIASLIGLLCALPYVHAPIDQTLPKTANGLLVYGARGYDVPSDADSLFYADVATAVVGVSSYDAKGKLLGGGTGVGLNWGSHKCVITASHVVDGASKLKLTLFSGQIVECSDFTHVEGNPSLRDVSVIKCEIDHCLNLAPKNPAPGTWAAIIGNPLDYSFVWGAGAVAGYDLGLMIYDGEVIYGNSGCAMIDRNKNVVGLCIRLTVFNGRALEHLGKFLPAKRIAEELERVYKD